MLFSMMIREPAAQTSPWFKKMPIMAHSTAPSRSASAKITLGDLPPSSRPIFLMFPAAARMMLCPTSVLPVKVIISTSSLSARVLPTTEPGPSTRFAQPFGRPTFSKISKRCTLESTQLELGLNTTLFPAARAGASFHTPISSG